MSHCDVGDIKLADFRDRLHSEGFKVLTVIATMSPLLTIQTEFKKGLLIVNDRIGLRRNPDGLLPFVVSHLCVVLLVALANSSQIIMEGALSPDYLKVKKLLYANFHIL